MRRFTRIALSVLALGVGACSAPTPTPMTLPTEPVVTEPANHAPSLSISYAPGPTCALGPNLTCLISLTAVAVDADGDPLTYSWSGCSGGRTANARCSFDGIAEQIATVTVNDGQGHEVSASATVAAFLSPTFVNHPPSIHISSFNHVGPTEYDTYPWLDDGEGHIMCGKRNPDGSCAFLRDLTITGDCKTNYFFECTCLSTGELDVYTNRASGSCELNFTLVDNFGMTGTTKYVLNFGPPLPSVVADFLTFGPRPNYVRAEAGPLHSRTPLGSTASPRPCGSSRAMVATGAF